MFSFCVSSDVTIDRVYKQHFLAKTIFPEGMGGVHKTCGNSGRMGGLLLCSKNGNSGEGGGGLA